MLFAGKAAFGIRNLNNKNDALLMQLKVKTPQKELSRMRKRTRIKRLVSRPFFFLARPFVAGVNASDAVRHVLRLNQKGGKGLINFLGEHYRDPQMVLHAVSEYKHLLNQLSRQREADKSFRASVSIKPSQFGFDLELDGEPNNSKVASHNMREIVREATEKGIPVEVDMESLRYTEFTLGFFRSMLEEFGHSSPMLRLCLQANLKRSEQDLHDLAETARRLGIKVGVRLVKGVYPEKGNPKAFQSEKETIENFLRLIEVAFKNSHAIDIAIGTHRRDIIARADALSQDSKVPYELQMLKGIGFRIKQERNSQGKGLTEYVPYGKDAIAYGRRRAKKMGKLVLASFLDLFYRH